MCPSIGLYFSAPTLSNSGRVWNSSTSRGVENANDKEALLIVLSVENWKEQGRVLRRWCWRRETERQEEKKRGMRRGRKVGRSKQDTEAFHLFSVDWELKNLSKRRRSCCWPVQRVARFWEIGNEVLKPERLRVTCTIAQFPRKKFKTVSFKEKKNCLKFTSITFWSLASSCDYFLYTSLEKKKTKNHRQHLHDDKRHSLSTVTTFNVSGTSRKVGWLLACRKILTEGQDLIQEIFRLSFYISCVKKEFRKDLPGVFLSPWQRLGGLNSFHFSAFRLSNSKVVFVIYSKHENRFLQLAEKATQRLRRLTTNARLE